MAIEAINLLATLLRSKEIHTVPESFRQATAAAFVDDLVMPSSSARDLVFQSKKLSLFCKWSNLPCNISKSAVASLRLPNGTTKSYQHASLRTQLSAVRLPDSTWTPQSVPILLPHQVYKYLGIQHALDLNTTPSFDTLYSTIKERGSCLPGAFPAMRPGLGVHESTISSLIRYHAMGTPLSSAKMKKLYHLVARSAKGISRLRISTGSSNIFRPKYAYGLGVTSPVKIYLDESIKSMVYNLRGGSRLQPIHRSILEEYGRRFGRSPHDPKGAPYVPDQDSHPYPIGRRLFTLHDTCHYLEIETRIPLPSPHLHLYSHIARHTPTSASVLKPLWQLQLYNLSEFTNTTGHLWSEKTFLQRHLPHSARKSPHVATRLLHAYRWVWHAATTGSPPPTKKLHELGPALPDRCLHASFRDPFPEDNPQAHPDTPPTPHVSQHPLFIAPPLSPHHPSHRAMPLSDQLPNHTTPPPSAPLGLSDDSFPPLTAAELYELRKAL